MILFLIQMGFKTFVSDSWNGIKSGVGTAGQYLQKGWNATKSGVGQAGKWVWDNKEAIGTIGGTALQTLGTVTGNPVLMGTGAAMKGAANAYRAYKDGSQPLQNVPDGEAKTALLKNIQDRQSQPSSYNKSIDQMNAEMKSFEGMMMANQKKKFQPITRRKRKYG